VGLRVGILTSDELRHFYVADAVADRFDVVTIVYQDTGYRPVDAAATADDERAARVVRYHFEQRLRQEERFFGHTTDPIETVNSAAVRRIKPEALNTDETVAFLKGQRPDVLLVYGTNLIKPPLLDAFEGRMINMHLGLSPYYRGTATNFYPLVNDEPEFVGATIHLIDAGIDSGAIVHQARPEIVADDTPHTVGCKAIIAGVAKIIQSLAEYEFGRMQAVPQWPVENPRLYRRRDYHPSHVVKLYDMLSDGLFPRYVERKARVENSFRLVP
jgi:folate-dependent phosphoribosylglycinamide formyltransferase PurN